MIVITRLAFVRGLLFSGGALVAGGALLAGGAFFAGGASAQGADCARLQAAIAAPARSDPAAANAARTVRAQLDKTSAYARSIGCDNQQFLFFGKPPPPQCGGLKARMAAMRAQFDALQARASGDSGPRRAMIARYNAACRQNAAPQREKGFFDTLFGGFHEAPGGADEAPATPGQGPATAPQGGQDQGLARGGSQALCVRSCDGGFFPLPMSARSASSSQLLDLCRALCPNAEVQLFTRNPTRDIETAVSIDGTPYEDLPNALKFNKMFDPNCGCKPPHQSWVEALAHAEQVLDEMGDARASDTTVTEQQAKAMSQPEPAMPEKGMPAKKAKGRKGAPAPSSDNVGVIAPAPAPATSPAAPTVESPGPDGAPRQVRVVGPKF